MNVLLATARHAVTSLLAAQNEGRMGTLEAAAASATLVDCFDFLDNWLANGGRLPDAWLAAHYPSPQSWAAEKAKRIRRAKRRP